MRNIVFFVLFAAFFIFDIISDLKEGIPVNHILHEVVLCLLALVAIAWQIIIIYKKNKHIHSLASEVLEAKKSYQEWKDKSHSSAQKIRTMIDEQFALWHLSHSEKDVALLLIKGFSMKEIASFRQTHEKTVRQQATAIYKKSSISGRQELAAFFLEDILSSPSDQNTNESE